MKKCMNGGKQCNVLRPRHILADMEEQGINVTVMLRNIVLSACASAACLRGISTQLLQWLRIGFLVRILLWLEEGPANVRGFWEEVAEPFSGLILSITVVRQSEVLADCAATPRRFPAVGAGSEHSLPRHGLGRLCEPLAKETAAFVKTPVCCAS